MGIKVSKCDRLSVFKNIKYSKYIKRAKSKNYKISKYLFKFLILKRHVVNEISN